MSTLRSYLLKVLFVEKYGWDYIELKYKAANQGVFNCFSSDVLTNLKKGKRLFDHRAGIAYFSAYMPWPSLSS